ncbi:MAG: deoxyribodipyrimidine photo-lyase [Candidatus Cloacimonetes bacterium]|nr:deoxyribodipyrimidine photo-lyase [Candidatus Cloacimonadota bacterium]
MNEARIGSPPPLAGAKPEFVLYWMQQSQRIDYNHALNLAGTLAAEWKVPLIVVFVLSGDVPEANQRHYQFMLEGLAETASELAGQGIPFHLCAGQPQEVIAAIAKDRAFVVADRGYLRWQRNWREKLSAKLGPQRWLEVESDVVVPVETASNKEEYAAATIRRKILKHLEAFLLPPDQLGLPKLKKPGPELPASIPRLSYKQGLGLDGLTEFAARYLRIDASVTPVSVFKGGRSEGLKRLDSFLSEKLIRYAQKRNDPSLGIQSDLSPWLHFGQISSLEVAVRALEFCGVPAYAAAGLIGDKSGLEPLQAGLASFLEELIIRRELSCNFCWFNPDYDNYACVPLWARQSLNDHLLDSRPAIYSPEELESAATDDPWWNAAQREMAITGKMHNYMRMYWGKKIIEWSPDPETAFQVMLWLNNKYQLDGRDPNSFAGIAWCFGKHDRPWQSRAVFGSVRYMNAAGLKRKFDMQGYLDKVSAFASP